MAINKKLSVAEITALADRNVLSISDACYLIGEGGEQFPISTLYAIEAKGLKLRSFMLGRRRMTRPAYIAEWLSNIESSGSGLVEGA